EDGPVLDGVQPDAGALVDRGVAADAAEIDEDPARAVGVDAAVAVAGLVVAEGAVVGRQRPGRADGVLEDDAAAVGRGTVVADDHVGQGQAGVAHVADAAAAGEAAVHVGPGGVEGPAAGDGEALEGDGEGRRGVGGVEVGVDGEDAVEGAAVHDHPAAAGVLDGQVAAGGQDGEGAGGVGVLAG